MKRALLSVSDKTGLTELARFLAAQGFEILSTGGTAAHLRREGLSVTDVGAVTGFPEILGGRVKTLHPVVHGGILADPSDASHGRELRRHGIRPVEVVAVNLYPFEEALRRRASRARLIEEIDIGGVALLRAAAKNHRRVTVLCSPGDYAPFMKAWRKGRGVPASMREALAARAFDRTAAYDAVIASAFDGRHGKAGIFPDSRILPLRRLRSLRYGENPHQGAAFYAEAPSENFPFRVLQGKELSFNNLYDMDAAWRLVRALPAPACAVIKHGVPCGAALGTGAAWAFRRAFGADPESAFGGVAAFNVPVDAAAARFLKEPFLECVAAPSFFGDAAAVLSTKPNLRLLAAGSPKQRPRGSDAKRIAWGWLMQDWDEAPDAPERWRVVSRKKPSAAQRRDLAFAWAVCRHVRSNAIVVAKNGVTLGIGAGQTSRVRSVRCALEQAGKRAAGAVLASDGFFPFRDSVDAAAKAGIAAIVQPGGSKRDADSIAACDEHGITMFFTGRRHFRH
jgi:phosphoribosylaminoimidazolecarboxamide formyltransferase/IMP cyclohydrolase